MHPVVDRVARGQQQDRNPLCLRAQPAQHFEAVHPRQADVEDHQVEALLLGGENRLLAARHDVHRVALGLQDARHAARKCGVVFDNHDAHGGAVAKRPEGRYFATLLAHQFALRWWCSSSM